MSVIVINIGNTNIRFGLFNNDNCDISWTINTKPYRTSDEFQMQFMLMYQTHKIDYRDIDKIIIGSVVPQITHEITRAITKIHKEKPIFVDRDTPSMIDPKSKQMGTDIYANLVGAQELYPQKDKIIFDFGTALTVSALSQSGDTKGVIIAPGVITSLNSLIQDTAQLPEIELKRPESVLGLDTVSCMQSGMVYGYLGMVEGFIQRINDELDTESMVIATGGLAHVFKNLTDQIHIADRLHTLKGLYYLGKNL